MKKINFKETTLFDIEVGKVFEIDGVKIEVDINTEVGPYEVDFQVIGKEGNKEYHEEHVLLENCVVSGNLFEEEGTFIATIYVDPIPSKKSVELTPIQASEFITNASEFVADTWEFILSRNEVRVKLHNYIKNEKGDITKCLSEEWEDNPFRFSDFVNIVEHFEGNKNELNFVAK